MLMMFQAEDGIRSRVRSRGLGDVYKRQLFSNPENEISITSSVAPRLVPGDECTVTVTLNKGCLLYTSDAADERSSVDLGGRSIITKKKT